MLQREGAECNGESKSVEKLAGTERRRSDKRQGAALNTGRRAQAGFGIPDRQEVIIRKDNSPQGRFRAGSPSGPGETVLRRLNFSAIADRDKSSVTERAAREVRAIRSGL